MISYNAQLSTAVASYCFATVPDAIREEIAEQTSAVNLPRIGSHENRFFTTVQMNVSSAEPYTPPPLDSTEDEAAVNGEYSGPSSCRHVLTRCPISASVTIGRVWAVPP